MWESAFQLCPPAEERETVCALRQRKGDKKPPPRIRRLLPVASRFVLYVAFWDPACFGWRVVVQREG